MEDLNKFRIINDSETAEELAAGILLIAENGVIMGRTKAFKAEKMSSYVEKVVKGELPPNVLTREFGIRQQALYIAYYENKLKFI